MTGSAPKLVALPYSDGLVTANAAVSSWQNALRSSGLRLVTSVLGPLVHTETSSSTQWPPALVMSVRRLGHDVSVRPRTTSASMSVHGPWQMAATGLPAATIALRKVTAGSSSR